MNAANHRQFHRVKQTRHRLVRLDHEHLNNRVRVSVILRHRIHHAVGGFGGYQAIRYDAEKNVYYGASESRKDGNAAGY